MLEIYRSSDIGDIILKLYNWTVCIHSLSQSVSQQGKNGDASNRLCHPPPPFGRTQMDFHFTCNWAQVTTNWKLSMDHRCVSAPVLFRRLSNCLTIYTYTAGGQTYRWSNEHCGFNSILLSVFVCKWSWEFSFKATKTKVPLTVAALVWRHIYHVANR